MPPSIKTTEGGGMEMRINGWRAPLIGIVGSLLVSMIGGTVGGIVGTTRWQGQIETRVTALESRADKQDQITATVAEIRGQLMTANSWRSDFSAMLTNILTQLTALQAQIKDLEMRRFFNEDHQRRR